MKNFCIFCGKPLVGGACECADYKAFYGYGDSAADMVFKSDPGRGVIETPATGARREEPVRPPVIPDTGPTVYAPITPGTGAFDSTPARPDPNPVPVKPTPGPASAPVTPGFGFKAAPEKKADKVSGDAHFKSAGDL